MIQCKIFHNDRNLMRGRFQSIEHETFLGSDEIYITC